MAATIKIKADSAQADAKLAALVAATENRRDLHATIGRAIVNRIRLCFKLGVDPWANKWAALKWRKGQPLRDTGRLQRSISSAPDDSGVTVGTNLIYAKLHQFGGTVVPKKAKRLVFPGPGGEGLVFAKKVTIPARPYMPVLRTNEVSLPAAWSALAVDAIRAHLRAAKKGEQ